MYDKIVSMTKVCKTCNVEKEICEFSLSGSRIGLYCKVCYNLAHSKTAAIRVEKYVGNYIIPDFKLCKKCNKTKEIDEFHLNKCRKDNHADFCKQCVSEYDKKRWHDENTIYKEIIETGYKRCTKCQILMELECFHKDPKGKEGRNSRCKKCILLIAKEKRHSDINTQLKMTLRKRMSDAVRKCFSKNDIKYLKTNKSLVILGCDIDTLKLHLESKFRDGMTWENRGSFWHIDHILPCCSFNLIDPMEQRKCFHYTNLQPLLVHENLSKSGKIIK